MAHKLLIAAFGIVAAASPLSATSPEPTSTTVAPAGSADTKYCLRVGPYTGSRLESIQCWTRQQWAEQCDYDDWPWVRRCVDVDKEWAENGVAVIG
jgi:hypothetical protein